MSKKGSQFNWVGAEVPSVRGGRRAHPPKTVSMINTNKINKNEMRIALISALSATANKKEIARKYDKISEKEIGHAPFIVESKFSTLKTKDLLNGLKKILGESLYEKISKKKQIRSGRGKMRGRKHKSNAGLLFVVGDKERIRTAMVESKNAKNLGVVDLAEGGLGRIVIYTESAIRELEKKLGVKNE